MKAGLTAAIGGALAIAAVSTLGDFVWAGLGLRHRAIYGLTHGAALFLCIGLYLGAVAGKPAAGAFAGALIGFAAAGSFYILAPITGYSVMFVSWFGVWIALGILNARLHREIKSGPALTRGMVAAVLSGIGFFLISGIWRPFDPQGWDYLTHFGAWTIAYLPGFAALLLRSGSPNRMLRR